MMVSSNQPQARGSQPTKENGKIVDVCSDGLSGWLTWALMTLEGERRMNDRWDTVLIPHAGISERAVLFSGSQRNGINVTSGDASEQRTFSL